MKNGLFLLLCVALGAGAWWWMHRARYTPGEAFLAIPAEADFVSRHVRPLERLPDLMKNPLVRLGLQAAEVDLEGLDAFCGDSKQLAALSLVLGEELVVARLPDRRLPYGSWLAASWVGSQGVQLHFLATLFAGDALEEVAHVSGHTLWRVKDAEEDAQIYFAVERELLLMSVGHDESGLLRMLETLAMEGTSLDVSLLLGDGSSDRGLLRTRQDGSDVVVEFDVEEATAEGLSLLLAFPEEDLLEDVAAPEAQLLKSFDGLVGDRARLEVMMPASWVGALGDAYLDEVWGSLTKALFSLFGPRPVFFSTFDGDMGGQIKMMRLPSLALAIPVTNKQEGEMLIREALLTMNKYTSFHLFNERVSGAEDTWAIGSGARNGYRFLRDDERVGYRLMGRWLIVSSSLKTLAKLPSEPGRGLKHTVDEGWGTTYGWVDLKTAMKSVRGALSMYMLALAFDSDATERRATLLMYRDWAELAGECGALQFSTQKVDKTLRLRVKQNTD